METKHGVKASLAEHNTLIFNKISSETVMIGCLVSRAGFHNPGLKTVITLVIRGVKCCLTHIK